MNYLSRKNLILLLLVPLTWTLSGCEDGFGLGDSEQQPDPVAVDFAIAYVKRPLPVNQNGDPIGQDLRAVVEFNPGAELKLRERASVSADDRTITAGVFAADELYDVKDLQPSYDGERFLFSMRAPDIPGADDDDQPKWNVWEYDLITDSLRRIITSDINAEAGHDISPNYLPDGRILFSSSRQRQSKATLLDESKPQFAALDERRRGYAMMLHVMDSDGGNIRQITFNPSHDLDPTVLSDGKILYSRWDHMGNLNQINLYTVNPDGSENSLLYGRNSHATGSDGSNVHFVGPRQSENGDILVQLQPLSSLHYGGDLITVDTENFIDNTQAVRNYSGSATSAQATIFDATVRSDNLPSKGGRYSSFFPLYDNTGRVLTSWSQCRLDRTDSVTAVVTTLTCSDENLVDPDVAEASPMYGIWMIDAAAETRLPVVLPLTETFFSDIVIMQSRTRPPIIADKQPGVDLDQGLVDDGLAVIHIRSVYDIDGIDSSGTGIPVVSDPAVTTADQRPARFLRIVKSVSIPDDDVVDLNGQDFGRSSAQLMREIIGYVPVEPDGSVKMKVPANVALAFSVVDSTGKRTSARHRSWIQMMPGEERECVGCHAANSGLPHGRIDAEPLTVNVGATGATEFPNTEPALLASIGESMATTYARINGVRSPTVDPAFVDDWTDPAVRAKDAPFSYLYQDLTTTAPTSAGCQTTWNNLCRIAINYPEHIHPIWQQTREVLDGLGNVIADNNCQGCHTSLDAMGNPQVPTAQLDLRDGPSTDQPDHLTSYRELMFNDNQIELNMAALVDTLVQVFDGNGDPVFQVDGNGDLILDINGDPIPVFQTVTISPSMSTAGALSSAGFYSLFETGGSHAGRLSAAELRLIYEWLDVGGQYYNNPFDVP